MGFLILGIFYALIITAALVWLGVKVARVIRSRRADREAERALLLSLASERETR